MSNQWEPITIDSLYEAKIAALIDACSTAAKATGQPDRAPGIIQARVDEVRMAVASSGANRVDSDETKVPRSLRRLVTVLIIADLKGVLDEPLTEDERNELARCERKLLAVAKGELKIDMPDTPVTPDVEAGGQIETIVEGSAGTSREELAGL